MLQRALKEGDDLGTVLVGRSDADRSCVSARRWLAAALTAVLVGLCSAQVSAQCVGDCDGNGTVTVSEIIIGVDIALGTEDVTACGAFASGDGTVGITQLVQAVNNVLVGCPVVCQPPCDAAFPFCGPDGNCWSGPCSSICSSGDMPTCCGGDFPNCGPDGSCWSLPCSNLCAVGDSCCGGDFPNCGPDGSCWSQPCATLCGDTCCGPGQRCLNNQTCSH
jgi:hypothetical protein